MVSDRSHIQQRVDAELTRTFGAGQQPQLSPDFEARLGARLRHAPIAAQRPAPRWRGSTHVRWVMALYWASAAVLIASIEPPRLESVGALSLMGGACALALMLRGLMQPLSLGRIIRGTLR